MSGGTEAMSCIGENTAMELTGLGERRVVLESSLLRWPHVLSRFARVRPTDLNLSLTTMADYDFRPAGSLNLKRTAADGAVKKCALVHL